MGRNFVRNVCLWFGVSIICVWGDSALQAEGDFCVVPDSYLQGRCESVHECDLVEVLRAEGKPLPPVCGFNADIPLICCPLAATLPSNLPLSTKMCRKYYDPVLQPHFIHQGTVAKPREFPHMAAIGFVQNNDVLWLCGASLISRRFVLSAAHCAFSRDYGAPKWVRLGELDLKNTTEDASPYDIKIVNITVHPNWKSSSHYHDIALFKLEYEASFGVYSKPACLHREHTTPASLQATGWGRLSYFEDPSSHLMKVDLKVVNHGTCARKFSNISKKKLATGIQEAQQICAGNTEGGDTCPGDSGGPLHFKVAAAKKFLTHFEIVGVTSFGKGCGAEDSAGVYARVSFYVDWIEANVWQLDEYN